MMNKTNSKWMGLAALLMFVAATFQFTSEHFIAGAVFCGAAACFTAAAGVNRKKEKKENQGEQMNNEDTGSKRQP